MKACGYLRVSTLEQVDGFGLDIQRATIERTAAAHRLELVGWWSDEGVSGTVAADERDGLAGALAAVEAGEAGALVVARLDRLARTLHVQEAALAHVWRAGGRVYADGTEVLQDDPDDPMRRAMRQMVGVFGELERSMIAKRMRDGARAKRAAGGYAGGAVPYGWRADGRGGLEVDENEQVIRKAIVGYRRGGYSLRDIIRELDGHGWQPRHGGKWAPQTVDRIAKRAEDDDALAAGSLARGVSADG